MMLDCKFHAKSRPFWGNEVDQDNLFLIVWHILSVSTGEYRTELTAAEKQTVPYQVCLEVNRDGAVGPLVYYD